MTRGVVACTICGSEDVEHFLSLDETTSIKICIRCRNAFTFPPPLAPDYALEDFQARGENFATLTYLRDMSTEIAESYNAQLQLVKNHVETNSRVLEIGGGEGIFLEMVKASGYLVEMVEPSITACQRAAMRGLTVHQGYFNSSMTANKFELVCMGHVLEHVADPIAMLKDVAKVLSAGGYLLLTQTNFKGFMPRFLGARWYAWLPTQHFSHFSVKGIKFLAKESGFSFVDVKHSRLVHGRSIYHTLTKYLPPLQDQIHLLLKVEK